MNKNVETETTAASGGAVRVERRESVALLTLDRPEGRNSFDVATLESMFRTVQDLVLDDSVRAVVVTGTGRYFCTGADVQGMRAALDDAPRLFDDLTLPFHAMLAAMRDADTVFVAAVNGVAAGGGVGLALSCDLVVAAEPARFVTAYGNLGISPDGGSTSHLVRAVGVHRAMEAMLLDEGIDAETGRSWGLVNRVVPVDAVLDAALELAQRAGARARQTIGGAKRLVDEAAHTSFAHILEAERRGIIASARTADFQEGVAAFFEKRPPRFA